MPKPVIIKQEEENKVESKADEVPDNSLEVAKLSETNKKKVVHKNK